MRASNAACDQALAQQRPIAHIKRLPSDWRVNEQLDIAFSGDGEHVYLHIEKEALNTLDVAKVLATHFDVPLRHIGYAGLKDKHAITRQWFSLPVSAVALAEAGTEFGITEQHQSNIRCLAVERHLTKLRRGQHSLNWFEIVLRDVAELGEQTLGAQLGDPFPNFFGAQRVSAGNVAQALAWLAKGHTRVRRVRGKRDRNDARGWHMSVLRSLLFNAVLERRVALDNFAEALPGDVLVDGSPTGPLWGRGRSAASLAAEELEQLALEPHQSTCAALEFTGLEHARRKLVEAPQSFSMQTFGEHDNHFLLKFALPPGVYATSLLAHSLTVVTDSEQQATSLQGGVPGE